MTWTRWSQAWNAALYGPDGFYRHQPPRAHFATSVAGIPGTCAVLAEALVTFMRGQQVRTFVDLGAGQPDLTQEIQLLAPDIAAKAIDIRPAPMIPGHPNMPLRASHSSYYHHSDTPGPATESSRDQRWISVPAGEPGHARILAVLAELEAPLVFAHEWLDVQPCEIAAVADDGSPCYVMYDGERGAEQLGGPITERDEAWCRTHWPTTQLAPGDRIEIGRDRTLRWRQLVQSIPTGVAIAVDYGHTAAQRPRRGTLLGYRQGRAVPAVPDGSCDLTAQVAMDSLGAAAVLDQRTVLRALGVDPRPPDPGTAAADPPAYLAGLARSAAAAALVGPGYGDMLWAICPGGARLTE